MVAGTAARHVRTTPTTPPQAAAPQQQARAVAISHSCPPSLQTPESTRSRQGSPTAFPHLALLFLPGARGRQRPNHSRDRIRRVIPPTTRRRWGTPRARTARGPILRSSPRARLVVSPGGGDFFRRKCVGRGVLISVYG
jgi:hypothetical protein